MRKSTRLLTLLATCLLAGWTADPAGGRTRNLLHTDDPSAHWWGELPGRGELGLVGTDYRSGRNLTAGFNSAAVGAPPALDSALLCQGPAWLGDPTASGSAAGLQRRVAVPEPSALLLVITGFGVLCYSRQRVTRHRTR
jgi:hypothetical protein